MKSNLAKYGRDRIAYIDLFAGPGRYKSGADSTPVMIVKKAIADPQLKQSLVCIFNDKDDANIESLKSTLAGIEGIETLKHQPLIRHGEVGEEVVADFESMKLVPTLSFIDPWGYKGMSIQLINSVIKDWGCDCFFFFNYGRVNAGLANDFVEDHMDKLFGKALADNLRTKLAAEASTSDERESFIVEAMSSALKQMSGKGRFVLPFRFRSEQGTRTTHHLFFVTKHFKGYDLMKQVMNKHCTSQHEGSVNFEFNPADKRQPSLYALQRPLDELGPMLLEDFAGQTLGIDAIYEKHSVGTPYLKADYRKMLCDLERDGKITMDQPCPPRKKGTLAPHVLVSFPTISGTIS